ncbi:MAG: lysine transporter LysE [Caulobacteraceae bacterium]|jgi:threonine/homoserine/homoserine lactone efflux protein|nr:lysine transporter LysE [Caulobacteraceae bacterium]
MTLAPSLIAYLFAAGLLTLTPGLDTAMVLRSATVEGRRPAILAAVGIGLGCLVWGASVALGLGALLTASRLAFTVLKWAGAAYLLYLGARLILRPRRALVLDVGPTRRDGGPLAPLRRGLLTNLLNPKVGVFYVSFLPQFTPPGVPMAPYVFMLACIHVVMGLIWSGALIAATVPIGRYMARPDVVTVMDRLTGCVFIAFGARLALSRR